LSYKGRQFNYGRGLQFVGAINDDGVGFFELLAEDVRGFWGKAAQRAGVALEDTQAVARLEQHRIRRYLEVFAVEILQGLHHGGNEIGTAADRLRENHVGALVTFELANFADEIVKATTEASAGHLLHGKALRTQALRVHEVLRLIVGHETDLLPAIHV